MAQGEPSIGYFMRVRILHSVFKEYTTVNNEIQPLLLYGLEFKANIASNPYL